MKIRYIAYFLTVLGIIIFCLAMSVWAYNTEHMLVDFMLNMNVYASTSELDIFLGLSIVGIIVIVLGLIIWVNSFLPSETV